MNKGCIYAIIISVFASFIVLGIFIAGYHLFNAYSKETLVQPEKIYSVKPGYTVIIKLNENPTTGYKWYYEIENKKVLKLYSDKYVEPETKAIGAGGTHIWEFKALSRGTTKIIFQYLRSGENNKKTPMTREYIIKVE